MNIPLFSYSPTRSSVPLEHSLPRCFFIYDSAFGDEDISQEERVLHFWPTTVDVSKRDYLIASCESSQRFADSIGCAPVNLLTFQRIKIALRPVEEVTMGMTGYVEDSDASLQEQLTALSSAFSFFYGPFSHVFEACGRNRRLYIDAIRGKMSFLTPLLSDFHQNPLCAFGSIRYSTLPENSRQCFVNSAQFLSRLRAPEFPGVYSGCIIHEARVVCTYLEPEVTRWVLTRSIQKVSDAAAQEILETSYAVERFNVYLTAPQVRNLIKSSQHDLGDENDSSAKEGPGFFGLFMVFQGKFSIGLILNLSAMGNHDTMQKLLKECRGRLHDINQQYSNSLSRTTSQSLSPEAASGESVALYNWLTFNNMTGVLRGSSLNPNVDADMEFLRNTALVHEQFQSQPSCSQMVLRDECGHTFCRRVFNQETYCQLYVNSNVLRDEMIEERLERTVRQHLSTNHNVQMF